MAARSKVELQVGADTKQAEKVFQSFGQWLKGGFGIDISNRLNAALLRVPQAIQRAVETGVKFNQTLEDSELGIAGLLRAIAPERFSTLDAAIAASAGMMRELRREAESTSATFGQLVEASQGLMGPALTAGIPLDRMARLASMIARTVGTVMPGAPGYQIMQEGRALLTGDIGPAAFVAKSIPGITREAIQEATKMGRLFEFLEERLGAFNEAAERGSSTFTVLASNLKDAFEGVTADATKPLFDSLKDFLRGLRDLVESPTFREAIGNLSLAAKAGVETGGTVMSGLLTGYNRAVSMLEHMFSGAAVGWGQDGIYGAMQGIGQGALDYMAGRVGARIAEGMVLRPGLPAEQTPSGAATSGWNTPAKSITAKALAEAMRGLELRAPTSGISRSGLFVTRAEAFMQRQGLNLQRTMVEELKEIRAALTTRGIQIVGW